MKFNIKFTDAKDKWWDVKNLRDWGESSLGPWHLRYENQDKKNFKVLSRITNLLLQVRTS